MAAARFHDFCGICVVHNQLGRNLPAPAIGPDHGCNFSSADRSWFLPCPKAHKAPAARFAVVMYIRGRALLCLAGLGVLLVSVAAKAACEPQGSFQLPMTFIKGVPLAQLRVHGKEAVLIVDTGAERTLLST